MAAPDKDTKANKGRPVDSKSKAEAVAPKKAPAEEQVRQAYRDVLGREADESGLKNYVNWTKKRGIDFVKKALASSEEASRRGVDPTKFGAKAFDPAKLSAKYQPYYEQWKTRFGNRIFTDFDAMTLKWGGDAYSPEAYGQKLAGNIDDSGDGVVITSKAVDALGPDLSKHFTGTTPGGFLFPRVTVVDGKEVAVTLKGDTFGKTKQYTQDGQDTGYNVVGSTGNLSSGLVGELGWKDPVGDLRKLGIGKDVIGAAGALSDAYTLGLADIGENILVGQKGSGQIDPLSAKTVGMSEKSYNRTVGYGQFAAKTAAEVALTATGAAAPVAMALEAGWQAAKAAEARSMRTDFDWANAVISTLAAGIQIPSNAVVASAAKAGAVSAGYDALSGRSVNWSKAAEAAAVGGVGAMGLLGKVGNTDIAASAYAIAKSDNKSDAWAAVAIQAGVGAAGAKAQGQDLISLKGSAFDTKWKGSFSPGGSRAGWNLGNADAYVPVRYDAPIEYTNKDGSKEIFRNQRRVWGRSGYGDETIMFDSGSGQDVALSRAAGSTGAVAPGGRFSRRKFSEESGMQYLSDRYAGSWRRRKDDAYIY